MIKIYKKKSEIVLVLLIGLLCSGPSLIIMKNFLNFKSLAENSFSDDERNLRLSNNMINIITPERREYKQPMAGYYPATYGFESDEVGENPFGWETVENGGPVEVVDYLDNHFKFVKLNDTISGLGNDCILSQNFDSQIEGTIEFYFRLDSLNDLGRAIRLQNLTENTAIHLKVIYDTFQYRDLNNNWHTFYENFHIDTWYHIRIDFNCATDTFDIFVNNNQQGTNLEFNNHVNSIEKIQFGTGQYAIVEMYIDAIGYSWDPNYEIGDNAIEGLLLSFHSPYKFDWFSYSLDNQANVTILGNTTISMPYCGKHKIQLFGENSTGIINESEQRYFYTTSSWIPDGIFICSASDYQSAPQICIDGLGGAIITWEDDRNGLSDIYAQKVDVLGNKLWITNGIPICTASLYQFNPKICYDGVGGVIITWEDYRNENYDIYAQRVNSTGDIQWANNGIPICTASGTQNHPQICSDNMGRVIITWHDYRNGNYDIYAQRVNSTGDIQWTTNGVPICTASGTQYGPQICSDNMGRVIITWEDYRNGNYDIYAQRVNSTGDIQWANNGVPICTASGTQYYPQICSDNMGGVIITWEDDRNGNYDIYAQRVNSTGDIQWITNGITICTASGSQYYPQICYDDVGGVIITWEDDRNGNYDIYAQRVNSTGGIQWANNGVPICTASGSQYYPQICSNNMGGAIITWHDYRNGTFSDIYAQRLRDVSKGNKDSNIEIITPESKHYASPMNGYYPATYGFENDEVGETPFGWETIDNGGPVEVIDSLDNHVNVVKLDDNIHSNGYECVLTQNFTSQIEGIIEFYFRLDSLSEYGRTIRLHNITGDRAIHLKVIYDTFQYRDLNNSWHTFYDNFQINTWYHIRIDFNCITDTFDIFVDNNQKGANLEFNHRVDSIENLQFGTGQLAIVEMYIDAIGYSWDSHYNIGDNLNEGLLLSFKTSGNLCWFGYSLDGNSSISLFNNTVIPMPGDGFHTIQVHGYDTVWQKWESELIHFLIDTAKPQIYIHSPTQDEVFGIIPPYYNVSIIEGQLVSCWYTLDDGINNYTITKLSNYIDDEPWIRARNGPVNIKFYAKDIANQTNYSEVIIFKETVQLMDVDIIHQSFSKDEFNITVYIYNDYEEGLEFATIQMWWDRQDVSADVQNLGNGYYFISLEPLVVAPGKDPILLNMTISALGYEDKYFEIYFAVDPASLTKSTEEFPLILVISISVLSVGVTFGVLIIYGFRKKRKKS